MLVEIAGIDGSLSIGARCELLDRADRRDRPCEVVGFRNGRALAMPFGALEGVGLGCKAIVVENDPVVRPTQAWLGRVINALGEPIDGKGPLPTGTDPDPHPQRAAAGARARAGSAARSTSASAPSTPSPPAAAASAWASSPAPASASRCCCR